MPLPKYDPQAIEKKWQDRWDAERIFSADQRKKSEKGKCYVLDMFPYPSSNGLHVGHPEGYTATDIVARKRRMEGWNVLHPMGWDAFGLPAENYAIKIGGHPRDITKANIENFRRQIKSFGFSYDWDREVSTCDPSYYKWTQWLFLLLYKNGLAYKRTAPVNWCNSCQTVLANEQVIDGRCERCKNPVVQKELEQWFFRITDFADRLLEGLDRIEWPEKIKAMQRNWIGRSEGAEINFRGMYPDGSGEFDLPVFTTRPDTLFGVTALVLAPEHPLVGRVTTDAERGDVAAYIEATKKKSELERTGLEKEKTGVFTGAYVKHPLTGENVPVFIADYVLTGYGTGAVMVVPAHDERDFVFAKKYGLKIKTVIAPPHDRGHDAAFHAEEAAYVEPGYLVNSGEFDGLTSEDAKQKITDALESAGKGRRQVNYHLRDWLVSRQRYWGAPIPIIYCEDCGELPVPEKDLPVLLPDDVDFRPTGESPLVRSKSFHDVKCPNCGHTARRESDTMDTFVDSSWYFLRYCDPKNAAAFASGETIPARHTCDGADVSPALAIEDMPQGIVRLALIMDDPDAPRGRARRPASSLRPLLHQGAVRRGPSEVRRAVPVAAQPGADPRRGRREDVEVPRQRRQSGRGRRRARRRRLPAVRDVHGRFRAGQALEHQEHRRFAEIFGKSLETADRRR